MVLRLSYAPRALTCVYCWFCIIHVHLEHNLNPAALTFGQYLEVGSREQLPGSATSTLDIGPGPFEVEVTSHRSPTQ